MKGKTRTFCYKHIADNGISAIYNTEKLTSSAKKVKISELPKHTHIVGLGWFNFDTKEIQKDRPEVRKIERVEESVSPRRGVGA